MISRSDLPGTEGYGGYAGQPTGGLQSAQQTELIFDRMPSEPIEHRQSPIVWVWKEASDFAETVSHNALRALKSAWQSVSGAVTDIGNHVYSLLGIKPFKGEPKTV
ncbi:MAG: hypothetical protein SFT81_03910 [Candidatus Caenarcaniphilales bacterium]|nr:hypothetical protein [Candidatus Caenarcaniphilales bacterium]